MVQYYYGMITVLYDVARTSTLYLVKALFCFVK